MKNNSIPETAKRIGCGRTKVYQMIAAGELRALKIGNRTVVPDDEIERVITSLPPAVMGSRKGLPPGTRKRAA